MRQTSAQAPGPHIDGERQVASIDRPDRRSALPWSRRAGPVACRALVVLVALALVGAWGEAAPATADQADLPTADWGVDVTAGVGGHVVGDTWAPVTVTLRPEAPFRGRILVMSGRAGSTVLQSRPVEVAADVEKRYVLLAPPSVDLQVQVVEEGTDEAVTLQPRPDRATGFLVGVLGGSDPAALPPVTLPMTDQRATAVAVDDVLLEMGPRALQSLSTLVVRQSDLAGLSEPARHAVTARVADGATLVVTGATDPDLGLPWRAFSDRTDAGLSPLPGAWAASAASLVDPGGDRVTRQPASDGSDAPDVVAIAAGRGRVVATTLEVGGPGPAGDQMVWEDLLQPDQHAMSAGSSRRFDDLPNDVEQAFGASAGQPPSFAWLAIFFVVYVVVTGPVLGMVLSRRRRPELAWVVVPLVTALFAGAAFVGATGSRPGVGVSARVATWVDGVGTTMAVTGVRAPRAGQHTIALPGGGWDLSTASWQAAVRVAEGTDTVATVQVPAQSLGAVVGWRPLDRQPPLDVEVALFDAEARVEVTNTSEQDLSEPTLRLATETYELAATLPAGETLVQTVALPDALPRQRDPFGEGVRGPFDRPGGPEDLASLARWELLDRNPGLAIVTATSEDDLGLAVASVDGTAPTDRGTLVAVGVTPSVTDDATTPFEVRRDLVAAGRGAHHGMPLTISGPGPATMRFRLPHEGAVDSLSLALAHDMGRFGGVQPRPPRAQPVERCGLLERRDADTGDVREATEACAPDFPCPPDATTCSWSGDGGERVEGQACFPDGSCQDLVWTAEALMPAPPGPEATVTAVPREEVPPPRDVPPPPPREAPPPPPDVQPPEVPAFSGLQVWNHLDRRWEDVPAGENVVDDEGATRWLSPLGEVWVRATGELAPFDLAPQGVAAQLGGPR